MWEIRYRAAVEHDVARLPEEVRDKALDILVMLGTNPHPPGSKKLKGRDNRYSIRLRRSYRLVYSVFAKEQVINVEFIGHRKDAYRWF